jgi:hypothetical protein
MENWAFVLVVTKILQLRRNLKSQSENSPLSILLKSLENNTFSRLSNRFKTYKLSEKSSNATVFPNLFIVNFKDPRSV